MSIAPNPFAPPEVEAADPVAAPRVRAWVLALEIVAMAAPLGWVAWPWALMTAVPWSE